MQKEIIEIREKLVSGEIESNDAFWKVMDLLTGNENLSITNSEEESLITFETAKLAKENDFDWSCNYYFDIRNSDFPIYMGMLKIHNLLYPAPTQAKLQKWLIQKHNINIWIDCNSLKKWIWSVNFIDENNYTQSDDIGIEMYFDSYEEALEMGLKYALKILKEKS